MLDWNPNDPDTVKVHYDVSAWTLDQRAELTEALAEADIAHVWDGDELVVPEELEGEVDELFARLEELLGPFPIPLSEEEPAVEYELDEWPPSDRQALTHALIEGEVPHRWEGAKVVVAADAEETVDQLLDAIEQGTLAYTGGAPAAEPPDGALSTLFAAADRLARDPGDGKGGDDLRALVPLLDPLHPPYGVTVRTWAQIVEVAGGLVELLEEPVLPASDVIGEAQQLRSVVRQYV